MIPNSRLERLGVCDLDRAKFGRADARSSAPRVPRWALDTRCCHSMAVCVAIFDNLAACAQEHRREDKEQGARTSPGLKHRDSGEIDGH